MLQMTDETRAFLQKACPDIPTDREHLNELLDCLDDLMLDTLDADYNSTEETRPIAQAYDDLYENNHKPPSQMRQGGFFMGERRG